MQKKVGMFVLAKFLRGGGWMKLSCVFLGKLKMENDVLVLGWALSQIGGWLYFKYTYKNFQVRE